MLGIDLIVTIGPDQQQMPQIGGGQQVLDEIQGRDIQPLQVVEEERERMAWPSEDADEAPYHKLKAPRRIRRRAPRALRLVADRPLQCGDEIDHELAERA